MSGTITAREIALGSITTGGFPQTTVPERALRAVTQRDIDRAEGRNEPLLLALVGGPGTGKSTTAALVFGVLKQRGYNAELVHEVAKSLTWEKRHVALGHQPYIAAKQMFNYDRVGGQVDVIVSDSSTLLSLIHLRSSGSPLRDLAFQNWILADWRERRTLTVMLRRNIERPYNPKGRSESEQEAQDLDLRIMGMLDAHHIPYMEVNMSTDDDHVEEIVAEVERLIA